MGVQKVSLSKVVKVQLLDIFLIEQDANHRNDRATDNKSHGSIESVPVQLVADIREIDLAWVTWRLPCEARSIGTAK